MMLVALRSRELSRLEQSKADLGTDLLQFAFLLTHLAVRRRTASTGELP